MSQKGDFYHPDDMDWDDYLIQVQFAGYCIKLADHVTEEEYKKLTPVERQELVSKIAKDHARANSEPFSIELIKGDGRKW